MGLLLRGFMISVLGSDSVPQNRSKRTVDPSARCATHGSAKPCKSIVDTPIRPMFPLRSTATVNFFRQGSEPFELASEGEAAFFAATNAILQPPASRSE